MPNQERANGPGNVQDVMAPAARPRPAGAPSRGGLGAFALRVLVVVLILALAYLAWRGVHVLLLAFAGVLFAVFLSALSDWLSRRTGLPYRWSLGAVLVLLTAAVLGLGWLLASRLATQAAELAQQLPESLRQIRDYLESTSWGRVLVERAPQAAESLAQVGDFSRVTGLVSGVAGFLVGAVVILFVGVFGAAEPDVYRGGLLHLIPPDERPRLSQALDAVVSNLRGWLVGQVVLMVVMGVTTTLGLWLLGVPLALTLGLITGVLELIPYVGAWISAVPALLVALLLGPWHVLMTGLLYLGLHILEGYVLVPLVQRRAVHLPPALTLVSQFLLGELLGALGLFVAAPLTVSALVFVKMLYVEDALGDHRAATAPSGRPGQTAVPPPDHPDRDVIEEASEESFPASDAPAWTPLSTLGPPHRRPPD